MQMRWSKRGVNLTLLLLLSVLIQEVLTALHASSPPPPPPPDALPVLPSTSSSFDIFFFTFDLDEILSKVTNPPPPPPPNQLFQILMFHAVLTSNSSALAHIIWYQHVSPFQTMAIYNGAEDARLLISPFELAVRLDRLNVVKEILRATSSETASSSSSSSAPTVSRSIMFSEEILGLAIKSHSMSVLKFLVCNHLDAYAEQQRDYIKSTIYSAIELAIQIHSLDALTILFSVDTNGKAISSYCTLSSSPPPPQPSDLPADLNQQQLPPLISPLSNIIKLAIEELDAIDSTIEEGDKASALSILEFLFQRQTEKIIAQISMSETSSFSSLIEPLLVESALAIGLGSTDAMIFILKSADQVFMSTTSGSSSLVTPPPPSDSSSSAFPTSSTNNNFVFANMPFSGHLKRPSGRGCWTVLGWAMKFRRFKIIELLCRGKSGTGSGSIGFSASLMVAYIFDCNTSTDQTNAGGRGRESLIIPNSLSPEQLAIALSYNEDEFNYISETCKSSSSASSATNMKLLAEKQRMLWDRESGSLLSTLILSQSLSTTTSTIHYSESFFLNIFNRANIVDRATFFTAKRNYGRSLLEYARSLLVPGATATTTTSASITSPTFATPLHQLLELRDNDIEADLLSDQPISNAYLAEYEDMEGFKLIGFTSLYNIDKLARLVKWVEDVLLMECRDQLHSTSTTTGSGSGTTSGSSSLILALLARLVSFNEEKLNQQRQLQDSDGVSSHQFYPLIDLPHTIHVGSVQTTLLTRMEVLSNEQVSLLARDLESRARRAVLEITGVCKVAGSTETKSPPPPPLPSWTTRTVFHRDDLETVVKTSHRLFIHFYRTYPRIFYAGLDGANDDAVDHHNENDGDNDSDYTSTKDFPDPTSFSLASIPQLRESAIERYISQNHHDSIKSAVETTIMEMATREAKAEMERARSNLQRQRTSSNTRTSTQGMRLPSFDKLKAGLLTTYNKLHFDSLYTKHRKFIRHELFKINTASAGVQKSLNDLFASGETMKLLSQLLQRRGEFISLAWGYNTNNGENGDVRLEDKTGWKNLEKQFIK